VLVIERMMSAGGAGAVSLEVMKALKGTAVDQKTVYAGLGGNGRKHLSVTTPIF